MRKIFLAVALSATVALGGCAQVQEFISNAEKVITIGTATVDNPITKKRLDQLELGLTVIFTGLNSWRTACIQNLIPASCDQQINAVQVYTRQLPPYLAQARKFVKNNDQVNARVVWNQMADIITIVKARAAAGGAPINGVQ